MPRRRARIAKGTSQDGTKAKNIVPSAERQMIPRLSLFATFPAMREHIPNNQPFRMKQRRRQGGRISGLDSTESKVVVLPTMLIILIVILAAYKQGNWKVKVITKHKSLFRDEAKKKRTHNNLKHSMLLLFDKQPLLFLMQNQTEIVRRCELVQKSAKRPICIRLLIICNIWGKKEGTLLTL
jgi:hypothetical protein